MDKVRLLNKPKINFALLDNTKYSKKKYCYCMTIEKRLEIVIQKLKMYQIPKRIAINSYTLILDSEKFIDTHISHVEKYKNNSVLSEVYLSRLEDFLSIVGNEHLPDPVKLLKKTKNK
jgi:formyltetrahydrofolate synthetase